MLRCDLYDPTKKTVRGIWYSQCTHNPNCYEVCPPSVTESDESPSVSIFCTTVLCDLTPFISFDVKKDKRRKINPKSASTLNQSDSYSIITVTDGVIDYLQCNVLRRYDSNQVHEYYGGSHTGQNIKPLVYDTSTVQRNVSSFLKTDFLVTRMNQVCYDEISQLNRLFTKS